MINEKDLQYSPNFCTLILASTYKRGYVIRTYKHYNKYYDALVVDNLMARIKTSDKKIFIYNITKDGYKMLNDNFLCMLKEMNFKNICQFFIKGDLVVLSPKKYLVNAFSVTGTKLPEGLYVVEKVVSNFDFSRFVRKSLYVHKFDEPEVKFVVDSVTFKNLSLDHESLGTTEEEINKRLCSKKRKSDSIVKSLTKYGLTNLAIIDVMNSLKANTNILQEKSDGKNKQKSK